MKLPIVATAAGILLVTGCSAAPTLDTDTATVPRIAACSEYADTATVPDAVPGVCGLTGADRWDSIDTADYGTDIPRCASDDYNADHVALCFTQRVTDGTVILLSAVDTTVATIPGR